MLFFYVKDIIFTLTKVLENKHKFRHSFWTSCISYFWIWSHYILLIFKIFDRHYENESYKEDI
jgi:hypothetical protein